MQISVLVIGTVAMAVVAFLAAGLGYLLAMRRAGWQISDLAMQVRQMEVAFQQASDRNDRDGAELAQLRSRLHDVELSDNTARTQLRNAHETVQRLDAALTERGGQYEALLQKYGMLEKEHVEIRTTLERKEEHFREQMQQLGEARQSLGKEFENLANRIFEEKGKSFADASQVSLSSMLKPFREQIEGFQKRVNEVHDASLQGNSTLNAEIRKVLEIGLKMSQEATNLTSALKGDSQQRGAWGEAQLRRTLEMSGLVEEAHYEVQSSFRDAEGRQKQTDYLIRLPEGKHIIIDSKVSLNAYDRAVAAESQTEHEAALREHVKSVRRHMDDLASKDYTNLIGMRSPGFVLMFMPIEPAYISALKADRDLFDYGYRKGIVLVSHTTLIPILRTVANLWMIERSNREAREISERAGDIYNSVCLVAERLNKLGGSLNTASNHYNSAVRALAGQQGLYGRVDRFRQLSAKVSKNLPRLEAQHMDFETERLGLIVEPVEDGTGQPVPATGA
ncbi:DNA recombination protein RmuC [Parasaccharibacter sp. TMW 2.1884]|uniref:DNA recombination protein RmuC n=1 Tax=Parasaccharibacter sp. TMW 2.1884 TaxID=2267834 RepID=UPI0013170CAB|nr:DNA recombination protein RmuC [Parasaccharibacter sp. TMW 2.1884]MCL1511518.1 DNA recombination protein RmuC [Parasaccharibacter sp. TMW 2.1884]QGT75258.1 DNA recombination protein RmuC [Bombella sp. ESL0368]